MSWRGAGGDHSLAAAGADEPSRVVHPEHLQDCSAACRTLLQNTVACNIGISQKSLWSGSFMIQLPGGHRQCEEIVKPVREHTRSRNYTSKPKEMVWWGEQGIKR